MFTSSAGVTGILSAPFFSFENGIFWIGNTSAPWKVLGANICGMLVVGLWSGLWSLGIFGGLKYFKILRIDRDTEFRGNDMVKHGESAYPVDAWVELQYDVRRKNTAPSNAPMQHGTQENIGHTAGFNDAMEMVPTTGKLFKQLSQNFDNLGFDGDAKEDSNKDAEKGGKGGATSIE